MYNNNIVLLFFVCFFSSSRLIRSFLISQDFENLAETKCIVFITIILVSSHVALRRRRTHEVTMCDTRE